MWISYIFLIPLFCIFALLQNSILAYFNIFGAYPNLVFVLFFTLIFFEGRDERDTGFWFAIIAGFSLDIFSSSYFGLSVISLAIIYFSKKFSKYFLKESTGEMTIFYFLPTFLIYFIVYNISMYLLSIAFGLQRDLASITEIIATLVLNSIVAMAGFYIYNLFVKQKNNDQLKLL